MSKSARHTDAKPEAAIGKDLKAAPTLALAAVDGQARKRGRPKLGVRTDSSAPALSREHILERATALAKVEPLGEISMVGLAKELGVAPTLIHYYIGSRDDLISGVANRYFKERVSRLQPLTGNWKEDLQREATQSFKMGIEYGGVLRYMMSHNRFRVFQQVSAGETDYGVLYLDRMASIFKNAGFTRQQSALGFHLLSQYVMSSSYAEVSRQLPGFHEAYIRHNIDSYPESELCGARYFAEAFSTLDSKTSFPEGLKLLIGSFETWLK
ncbi:MAG: TetR family transcriptional regulator [Polaromonas sp.]|nr:TetR family transcriptional regulator [Polaromonas sp.]